MDSSTEIEKAFAAKGCFITLEGIEGAGKSTMLQYVVEMLSEANIPCIKTREPGGTVLAENIRDLLLADTPEPMALDTELLLMFASRAQHIDQIILPALWAGKWLVSDRFTDATYAYQGGGRGIPPLRISQIEDWVQGALRPDCTIILDVPVGVGMGRIKQRQATEDRIEQEQHEFFERVRAAYLERAEQDPLRCHVVDATQPIDIVKQAIGIIIQAVIDKNRHIT